MKTKTKEDNNHYPPICSSFASTSVGIPHRFLNSEGISRQKTSTDFKNEVKNLRLAFINMFLKHITLARELQSYRGIASRKRCTQASKIVQVIIVIPTKSFGHCFYFANFSQLRRIHSVADRNRMKKSLNQKLFNEKASPAVPGSSARNLTWRKKGALREKDGRHKWLCWAFIDLGLDFALIINVSPGCKSLIIHLGYYLFLPAMRVFLSL